MTKSPAAAKPSVSDAGLSLEPVFAALRTRYPAAARAEAEADPDFSDLDPFSDDLA